MSSINNYINQINRGGGISSFSSVEDLIRSHLGNSFIDRSPEIPIQEPIYQDEEGVDDIISSSMERLKKFNPEKNRKEEEDLEGEIEIKPLRDFNSSNRKDKESPNKSRNYYPFYRDVEEVFEFKVTVEGSSSNTTVRLLLENDSWNIMFQGKLKKDGICSIPIKKLSIFPLGTIGKATLEVIIDDILFTPWESPFRIEESKRVEAETFRRRPKNNF